MTPKNSFSLEQLVATIPRGWIVLGSAGSSWLVVVLIWQVLAGFFNSVS